MAIDLEKRGDALENEYFHRREQELIAKMKAKMAEETSVATEMNCPRCDGKLVETDFESIKIDVCNACTGVWLDPGELTQITDTEKDGGGFFSRIFG